MTANDLQMLSRKLDLSMDDFVAVQEAKSLAVASGKLTPDEGQTVYGYLGNSPSVFNARPLAVKVAITKLITELAPR